MKKVLMFFLFITILTVGTVSGYKPLGSQPPEKCRLGEMNRFKDCPSHYMCEPQSPNNDRYGECHCDRLYGFYGPTCRTLSVASYMFAALSFVVLLISVVGLYYNTALMWLLYTRNKLTKISLITLSLSSIASFVSIFYMCEYVFVVFEVDKNMVLRQLRIPFATTVYLTTMISSMEISGTWIRLTQNVSQRDIVFQYRLKVIGGIAILILLIVLVFMFLNGIEFLIIIAPILIGTSHWYGGNMAVKTLRTMHAPGRRLTPTIKNALELAYAAEATTKNVIFYCVSCTFWSLVITFTYNSRNPHYRQQNRLPRWAQGQFAIMMTLISLMAISHQVALYFHFTCLRFDMEFVPLKLDSNLSLFTLLWNMFKPQTRTPNHKSSPKREIDSEISSLSELDSIGVSESLSDSEMQEKNDSKRNTEIPSIRLKPLHIMDSSVYDDFMDGEEEALSEGQILKMAADRIESGNGTLDPDCDPFFRDKKMVFDMSEDEEVERRRVNGKVTEMKRQMEEVGVFEATEKRARRKKHAEKMHKKNTKQVNSPQFGLGVDELESGARKYSIN